MSFGATSPASEMSGALQPVRRMPAQWEACEAVWLAWPHNLETWPGHFEGVPEAFAVFAHAIAQSTPVRILAAGPLADSCRDVLRHVSGNSSTRANDFTVKGSREIEIVDIPTNDCWIRDYGPTFVQEQAGDHSRQGGPKPERLLAINWNFNAWGGKYHPYDLDQAAGAKIAKAAGLRCLHAELTLEGGALETDGNGRLLVHSACILDPDRNPDLTKDEIAARLYQYLGVDEIAWIDGGLIPGDDTDGHIDQIARFLDPEHVVVAVAEDRQVPFYAALEANYEQIRLWGMQTSPNVTVHRLPSPPPRTIDGQSVPQSYCNFLRIGPDRILVPTFAEPTSDERALGLLADLCPGVQIQGVPCEEIAWGLGALHCASCHQPAALK